MPRARDLLYRFRPAGAPGPATAAGVPADRSAERATELAAVFAALSATRRECARLIADAEHRAADIRSRGADRVAAIAAGAASRVPAERAMAAARVRRAGDVESADELQRARRSAAGERDRWAAALPGAVAATVTAIAASLGTADTDPPRDRSGPRVGFDASGEESPR